MTQHQANETEPSQHAQTTQPSVNAEALALLYCTDLMFIVPLQKMARSAGFHSLVVKNGADLPADIPSGSVMVVDLSSRDDWEEAIRKVASRNVPVVAFGPHMGTEERHRAKSAGAARVLANSNLARDLPTILLKYREQTRPVPSEELDPNTGS